MDSDNSQYSPSWSKRLLRIFRGCPEASTEEELQNLIDASEQKGIIDEDEGDMLQSILELDETIVREVMVPRTAMVCVDAEEPLSAILAAILKSGHSRIPIYKENNDNIIGLVYAKDLLRFWGQSLDEIKLEDVLRSPFLVPESKLVSELLQEFRETRIHIAIIIDEYGGTSGLVTIEDLIEEIVGEIRDEYDLEEDWLVEEPNGTVLVDGRLNIEDFEEHFAIDVKREKFDTVGGYVVEYLGRVPAAGERFEINSLELLVVAGNQRAVRQLRIFPKTNEVAEPG
ncbi:MAG: hemolysin family protein [Geopsychrobacter sp.]|nr:hemolysin family protein [Geopsychrobacter sp.]